LSCNRSPRRIILFSPFGDTFSKSCYSIISVLASRIRFADT
jgi:hypothetical protein